MCGNGIHRFLVTGDFIRTEKGRWMPSCSTRSLRADYLRSLALIRKHDFDVFVPWGTTEVYPPIELLSSALHRRHRIGAVIE